MWCRTVRSALRAPSSRWTWRRTKVAATGEGAACRSQLATRDGQRLPGHRTRVFRYEIGDGGRNFFRLDQTALRIKELGARFLFASLRPGYDVGHGVAHDVGLGITRADRIDSNAGCDKFRRQR